MSVVFTVNDRQCRHNAVAQLTGVRLREAPMTPECVKRALG